MTLLSDIASTAARPPSISSALTRGYSAAREASKAALRGAIMYHNMLVATDRRAK